MGTILIQIHAKIEKIFSQEQFLMDGRRVKRREGHLMEEGQNVIKLGEIEMG